MKKLFGQAAALAAAGLLFVQPAFACTGVYVGKDLTDDGSVIFGRTEDLEENHNKTFIVVEAKKNEKGAKYEDKSNGFTFELPAESYKYTAIPDVTPEDGDFHEAGFNEFGVVADMTVSAGASDEIQKVDPYVEDGLAESHLTNVVLPHVKSAREGIEMIAKLLDEKGAAEGDVLILADQKETWYMEILSGHQYAAMVLPSDKYAVFPNAFWMGAIDPNDQNMIVSKDLVKVAEEAKTIEKDGDKILVAKSYNPKEASMRNSSRMWSGIKALDPDSTVTLEDENFDLLQSTDKKFSVADVMALQRNRFNGEFPTNDRVKEGEKEPEGSLYPIGNVNTMEAHIFQVKEGMPAEVPGVMWLAMGSPLNSPYLPYYGNITDTAAPYKVQTKEYDPTSFYWVASHLKDMALTDEANLQDVTRSKILELEQRLIAEQPAKDQELIAKFGQDPKEAAKWATETSMATADEAFKMLQELEKQLAQQVPETTQESTTAQ
ncbi:C69 family dipeptidase [Vaginisenegalia massiliensis]|uniref:C69 family dipeptidase n=1 Tax=Vaginisenegalia massiliensis TaxID=2058294 RepID=UPI000F53CB23|nr:C69 family dipeptidase [Vaginisenegalia massiliensis]